ncbi:helix-turn-helix domain-containing protein [Cecembia rubra]|uniref:helix-turn-helix domain-containing protein n=1 Tax=Cecembia rubra TaxID=1485585 RepID=UPI002714FF31|nr:helix-turn-helix transcriptional regulator [Cecembia rubra]
MRRLTKKEFRILLGERIKQIRESKELTQEQLAFKMGYKDKQVVSRYEREGANPNSFTLIQICQALDVSVEEILDFLNSDT